MTKPGGRPPTIARRVLAGAAAPTRQTAGMDEPAGVDPAHAPTEGARFVGMETTADPLRWRLPVTLDIGGGRGGLFGGCAVAAAVAGLERATGRPLQWITAQFLVPATPPDVLEFELAHAGGGRNLTQARVEVRVGDRPTITMLAGLGRRADGDEHRWLAGPGSPPPPRQCPPAEDLRSGLRDRFDLRLAGRDSTAVTDGRSRYWCRADGVDLGTAEMAAIVTDFVPFGLTAALGRPVFGSSLDNTVRIVERVSTEWALVEYAVESVDGSVAHVSSRVWSETGRAVALASQTCVVMERPDPT